MGVKERVKSVLNYKKPAIWVILVAIIACIAVAVCFLTDPAGISLAEQWNITSGEITSITITAGENSMELSAAAEIEKVVKFLESARIDSTPISQNRSEDRAKDYSITLSGGPVETTFYFDMYFTDMWVDDGVKPSLSYGMMNPVKVRTFFQTTLGIEIPDETATAPDGAVSFLAKVLRVNEGSVLVSPVEGSDELRSSDRIWVSLNAMSAERVPEIRVGDEIRIAYDGMIAETYPAWIDNVSTVTIVGSVLTDQVIKEIEMVLGDSVKSFFDYQTFGEYAVMGCAYGGRYGLVYFRGEELYAIRSQEQMIRSNAAVSWWRDNLLAPETGSRIHLIADPEIAGLYIPGQPDSWLYLFNYPAVLVTDAEKSYAPGLDGNLVGGYLYEEGNDY